MKDMIQASTLVEVLSGLSEDALEDFLSQYDEEWVAAVLAYANVDYESMAMVDDQIDAVREIVLTHC